MALCRYAIYADEAKYFLMDTGKLLQDEHGKFLLGNGKGLCWLLRASEHLSTSRQELNGQEQLPPDNEDSPQLKQLIAHIRSRSQDDLRPLPTTGPDFFPLVYVIEGPKDSEDVVNRLEGLRFTRGGRISVVHIPENPWCRESSQDRTPEDRYTWGTLMPLYFKEIGRREKQWLVEFFATRWTGRQFNVLEQIPEQLLHSQWNADGNRLFARHVAVALIHPLSVDRVLLLLVWQHDFQKKPKWNVPGGSVDRGVDTNWVDAAKREFQEELNPAGLQEWSAANAIDESLVHLLSIQNLLPFSDIQNMSRPSLNFVVARARSGFYAFTSEADAHKDGGRKIKLPPDFVTALPASFECTAAQRDVRRYWQNKELPFLEHERFEWVPLDLKNGKPEVGDTHSYVDFLAKALQQGSVPRNAASMGPRLNSTLMPEEGMQISRGPAEDKPAAWAD